MSQISLGQGGKATDDESEGDIDFNKRRAGDTEENVRAASPTQPQATWQPRQLPPYPMDPAEQMEVDEDPDADLDGDAEAKAKAMTMTQRLISKWVLGRSDQVSVYMLNDVSYSLVLWPGDVKCLLTAIRR